MPTIRIVVLLSLVLLLSSINSVEARRPINPPSSVVSSDGNLDDEEIDLEDLDDGDYEEAHEVEVPPPRKSRDPPSPR